MILPEKFEKEMEALLGDQYEAYRESLSLPVRQGCRVNTWKVEKEKWEGICPFAKEQVPWIENGYFLSEDSGASRHPYYFAGLYYLQEPSAMTPANRLEAEPGDYILDLCAAPGGKATELGSRLRGKGLLFANDISNSRAKALLKNLEMAGIPNLYVTSEKPENLEKHFPEFFDKVLIDAPCSGEGMFHREPKMAEYWMERGPEAYVPVQRELILQGARMLKPGGRLLYSTCTFSIKEDEEIIQWLLEREPDMYLLPVKPYEGFEAGRGLDACVRIFPHKMDGEGHFLALLGKKKREEQKTEKKKSGVSREKKQIVLPDCAEEFLSLLLLPLDRKHLKLEKDRLYLLPEGPEMPKLRYLRTGLFLGEIRKNRFEPAQALAMALRPEQFASCIHLDPEDVRTVKYLKGETLDVSDLPCRNEKGWQLVCVGAYPLGFGKLSGGKLKNKYYAGWRWQ
ncbi:MAG: RsmF rRNA methyltransferase first C-terminal domain-containing protein [Blautia sp.]